MSYQSRLLRFLENHDEPRVAAACRATRNGRRPCAVATLPGATLWHEGQFEGRRVRPPVFLRRRPDEPPDRELADWYRGLLATARRPSGPRAARGGCSRPPGWPDNQSCRNLIAWSWSENDGDNRHVVVVNLCRATGAGADPAGMARPGGP